MLLIGDKGEPGSPGIMGPPGRDGKDGADIYLPAQMSENNLERILNLTMSATIRAIRKGKTLDNIANVLA